MHNDTVSYNDSRPEPDRTKAAPMRLTIVMPNQKAEKLPATTPERMLRLAPPWREERTILP